MLTNAIEHGNMEIDEEEKTELIQNKDFNYSEELERRSKEKPYCDRKVTVEAFIDHGKVKYIISDQGQGFEY